LKKEKINFIFDLLNEGKVVFTLSLCTPFGEVTLEESKKEVENLWERQRPWFGFPCALQ
jgi:hypothetical protein